jgi:hypothetical protein
LSRSARRQGKNQRRRGDDYVHGCSCPFFHINKIIVIIREWGKACPHNFPGAGGNTSPAGNHAVYPTLLGLQASCRRQKTEAGKALQREKTVNGVESNSGNSGQERIIPPGWMLCGQDLDDYSDDPPDSFRARADGRETI